MKNFIQKHLLKLAFPKLNVFRVKTRLIAKRTYLPSVTAVLASVLLGVIANFAVAQKYSESDATQGWDNQIQELFYHTAQGSPIMPYKWFMALKTLDGSTLFSDPQNLKRYGFIPSPYKGPLNPDGLPIGLTLEAMQPNSNLPISSSVTADLKATENRELYVGMTCSACHTREVTVQGKTIRIDGAPAMLDFDKFLSDLSRTFASTLTDRTRSQEFFAKVADVSNPQSIKQVQEALKEFKVHFSGEATIRESTIASGFGRVDALTQILNSITARDQAMPLNLRKVIAPVSYPPLWLAPQLEFVQWNPIAASPIGRNGGQVLGVFGSANLSNAKNQPFESTIRLGNLANMEKWLTSLNAPKWNEESFGAIDDELADKGKTLFSKNCAACHNMKPYQMTDPAKNYFDMQFIKIGRINYKAVGTDPTYISNLLTRNVAVSELTRDSLFKGRSVVSAAEFFAKSVGAVIGEKIKKANLTPEQIAQLRGYRSGIGPNGEPVPYAPPMDKIASFKASPLEAAWATGPYLHNGSVPTIYELLSPVEERRKVFWVGGNELDLERLGQVSSDAPGRFRFDTSIPGNLNIGHQFPVRGFSHDERMAVIEFLKTQ